MRPGTGPQTKRPLTKLHHRHLRPATGQFEQFEIDFTPRCQNGGPLPACEYWWQAVKRATANKSIAYREDTAELLHAAGFTDIEHREFPLPWTAWMRSQRELAFWYRSLMCEDRGSGFQDPQFFSGLAMAPLTRNEGWTRAQVDTLIADVLSEVENPNHHAYHVLYVSALGLGHDPDRTNDGSRD